MSNAKLWNNVDVKVVGVTGAYGSGKTFFVLSICPEETLMIDLEDSAAIYANYLPIKQRLSLYEAAAAHALNRGEKVLAGVPSPVQCFHWFFDTVTNIKPGEFSVLAIDPISDIEQGLVQYVYEHPAEFGYTKNQFDKTSGLLWGAVKGYWKIILGILSSKVQTLAFTTHMGNVYAGGKPVPNKFKPKGKSTLFELSSLYVELERKVDDQGNFHDIPMGKVLKHRLSYMAKDAEGYWQPTAMLPPRLPEATYKAICQYIQTPPDLKNLSDAEMPEPEVMSEDERMILQATIAEAEKDKEEAQLERMRLNEELINRRAQRIKAMEQETAVEPEVTAKVETVAAPGVSTASESPVNTVDGLVESIKDLAVQIFQKDARQFLQNAIPRIDSQAEKLADLSPEQLEKLLEGMRRHSEKK